MLNIVMLHDLFWVASFSKGCQSSCLLGLAHLVSENKNHM